MGDYYSEKTHVNIGTEDNPYWMPRISEEDREVFVNISSKIILPYNN